MKTLATFRGPLPVLALAALMVMPAIPAPGQEMEREESSNEARWYAGAAVGLINFEGDEEVDDSFVLSGHVGYDYNERWTFEGVVSLAPDIDIKESSQTGPLGVDSTSSFGLAVDGLFHFTRWERVDPYLAAGIGFVHYADKLVFDNQDDVLLRGGCGVMYHINDEWAVRADFRAMLAGFGESPNANSTLSAGLNWTWGARVPPRIVAVDGPTDSDGDGLSDVREGELGTDPYDPDTDKDRLSDGDEVNVYGTNPLKDDTDFDNLKDGDEVLDHRTDPLRSDTDDGGVADGHEVLEDNTDPLDPADDLVLYTLNIEFDTDKSIIKPQYFSDIDVIAKVLRRNPHATAVVEGHADKRRTSGKSYNQRLSERRAGAVLEYLVTPGGIKRARMRAVGHGFSRPKERNDPARGNRVNRRVEVYIRGISKEQAREAERAPEPLFTRPEDK